MGRIIAEKVRGMNWKAKISLILIFTMVFSTFMYQGFYKPGEVQATIANVSAGSAARTNGWAHPSTGTAGPYTITDAQFSCGNGPNRLLVAIVTAEYATTTIQNATIQKGAGNTFTKRIDTGSFRRNVGIYTLPEANINGNTNSITVTMNGTPTGSDVLLACFSGVDQGQPIVTGGTYAAGTATASAGTTFNVAAEKGGYVVFGLATGTGAPGLAALTGYSETFDLAGTGYGLASAWKQVTTTGTETASPTWSSQTWGITVASLKPAAPTVTLTSPNNMEQSTGPTTVTITGSNFEAGATVSFSGTGITLGSPTVVNSTTITIPVTVAASATIGTRNVTVTNTATDGLSGTGISVFTVNAAGDTTPPTVSNVAVQTGLTVDVSFNELMGAGVTTASNYTISGTGQGSLSSNPDSVVLVSGATYRLTWISGEMKNGGDITLTVANAQDFFGNTITSPGDTGTHTGAGIGTSPTVTINQAVGQSDPAAASPINFTVVFSEPTTTFATGDVTITGSAGGTKTATVTGSGTTYNVAVTGMTTAGTVIATLLPGVATDAAGNPNLTSTSTDNSVNYNNSYPVLSITQPDGISDSLMVGGPFTITYTLSDSDDIVTAAFYYDNNNTGLNGTAISGTCATAPEGTNATCSWDTTGVTPGSYFIYGITNDGRGNISAYSVGAVTVLPTCTPTAPLVEITGQPKFVQTDNGNVVYSVTVTNQDFGGNCTNPLTINLGSSDSNSPKFSSGIAPSVSLAPGASTTVNLTVTEATAATDETTTTTVTASAAGHSSGNAAIVTTYHPNNPLVHNSISTESTKWSSFGGWGVENRKYGKFDCDTCHVRLATNVKSVRSTITTPDTSKGTLPGDGQTIVFDRTSWTTVGEAGTMGDDSDTPRATSGRICEVCHTYDATAVNGNKVHAYNTGAGNLGNHMNANATDCTVCHKHSVGFKTVSCETCHGMPPVDAPSLAGYQSATTGSAAAGKHATHVTTLGFDCDSCHKDFVMPQLSTPKPGFWDISIKFSNFGATTGSYTGQAGISYNQVLGTGGLNCSTVYCHGGKDGGLDGVNKTPSWTGSVVCGDCHKATMATPPTLGGHARHSGNAAGQLRLLCSDCHGANGAGSQGHVDGKIQWDLNNSLAKIGANAKYNGSNLGTINNLAPSSSYQTCATLYCHSNVQGANGVGDPTDYKTPQWGGGSLGCGGCHTDNSGAAGSGSHVKHSNVYSFTCTVCHNASGSGTAEHADYTIDLNFSGQATGAIYSQAGVPGNGYGTCSIVYCHSNVQAPGGNSPATAYGSPEWGNAAQLSCGFCHTDMSTTTDLTLGTHQRHTNAAGVATYSCSMCHGNGYSWNTVNLSTHANGNIDTNFTGKATGVTYSQAGSNTPGVGGYGTCATNACHGRATKNWGVSTSLTVCEKCHGSAASIAVDGDFRDTAGAVGSAYSGTHKSHLTAGHNYTQPIKCETCHVVPTEFGDVLTGVGHTGTLPATITWSTLARGGIADWTTMTHSNAAYSGAPGRTCSNTYCHSRGGAKPTPFWGDLGYGLSCGNCHGYPPAAPHPTGDAGANCKGCHYHVASSNTGFEASYRLLSGLCSIRTHSSDKITCESNGGTWTDAGTTVPGNSLHVDGIVLVDEDRCLNCHSTEGDFALIGQHYMHTDNDYFLSTSRETGSATGGSQTSVVNTGASWTSGAWNGFYVRVTSSGLDHGRQLEIESNTPTSLTVKTGKWFSSAVANGTSYNIREGKKLSNDDYDDPSWIYSIMYDDGFPRYACGTCHPDNSATHRNGLINLDMDPTHSLPGTVKTKNAATNQFSQTESGVNVTCNNVYCHSNGYMSPSTQTYQYKAAPNWYAVAPWASVDRCSQCHGNSPNTAGSTGSPAHAKHARGIHTDDIFAGTNGKMPVSASHGDGNSTIVNCNVCHYDTVKVAYNDGNTICATCHGSSAPLKGTTMVDPVNTTHINGQPDVIFSSPLNLKTKAQLRDDITWVTILNQSWSRQNGYKWSSLSHDRTKLDPTYSAGTCSNTSCHNATPMQWNQAGPLQCMVCHTKLPN